MSPSSVLAFWAVAAMLVVVPGPDWAFALSAGLRHHVISAASGIVLGYAALTLLVAAGLGVVIATTPAALAVLTVGGGVYLVWLGARTWRRPARLRGPEQGSAGSSWATVGQGMAVSGLNPKGLLVFVALLPQFADPEGSWPMPVQLTILGLAFTTTCGAVYLAVAATARRLLRARPAAARLVSRISGASMVGLGLALLLEQLAS
ncbi:MAG: LysE family translocator [Nocardioidaceae bacterium]